MLLSGRQVKHAGVGHTLFMFVGCVPGGTVHGLAASIYTSLQEPWLSWHMQ